MRWLSTLAIRLVLFRFSYTGSFRYSATKTLSIVSLNKSSTILGISDSNSFEDSSRHGLVFTSINHELKSASSMKSKPKSSKQCLCLLGFNF